MFIFIRRGSLGCDCGEDFIYFIIGLYGEVVEWGFFCVLIIVFVVGGFGWFIIEYMCMILKMVLKWSDVYFIFCL